MKTDPVKRAFELRKSLVSKDKVLVVDFSDTLQGMDTTKIIDLMPNVKTGELVFRTKCNVKDIDPIAAKTYDLKYVDIKRLTKKKIEDHLKKQEFDFPLWFKHNKGFKMKNSLDYNLPFILQVGGCNFHDGTNTGGCLYCFVDNESNDGVNGKGKTRLSVEETIESMQEARKKVKGVYAERGTDLDMKVLRTSGGEPTIVLDWILNLWRQIDDSSLVGQIDSNLSTGIVVNHFEKQGVYEKNILEKLAEHPIKVLTALKGADKENLQSNVQSYTTIETQIYSLKRFLSAGFDIYPQMYNPNPQTLEAYLERMDSIIENFSLKIHIGPLKLYSPNNTRLTNLAKKKRMTAESFINFIKCQWRDNYDQGCDVLDSYLQKKYKLGYKDTVRSDVELKVISD